MAQSTNLIFMNVDLSKMKLFILYFRFSFVINVYKCVRAVYIECRCVLTIKIVHAMFTFWSHKLNCDDFSSILPICYFIIASNYISNSIGISVSHFIGSTSILRDWDDLFILRWFNLDWFGECSTVSLEMCFFGFFIFFLVCSFYFRYSAFHQIGIQSTRTKEMMIKNNKNWVIRVELYTSK